MSTIFALLVAGVVLAMSSVAFAADKSGQIPAPVQNQVGSLAYGAEQANYLRGSVGRAPMMASEAALIPEGNSTNGVVVTFVRTGLAPSIIASIATGDSGTQLAGNK
jgi:hypothetical protein